MLTARWRIYFRAVGLGRRAIAVGTAVEPLIILCTPCALRRRTCTLFRLCLPWICYRIGPILDGLMDIEQPSAEDPPRHLFRIVFRL